MEKLKITKKLLSIALALALALALAACGGSASGGGGAGGGGISGGGAGGDSDATSASGGGDVVKPDNVSFVPDKPVYWLDDAIRITMDGVTREMIRNGAFIGMFSEGTADDEHLDYAFVEKSGSSEVVMGGPEAPGNYELRLFVKYSESAEALTQALMQTIPFTVEDPVQGDGYSYPAEWPADIPKMDGKIIYIGQATEGSGMVTIEDKNIDEVVSYINTLESNGFKRPEGASDPNGLYDAIGAFIDSMGNGVYEVMITFDDDSREVSINYILKEWLG